MKWWEFLPNRWRQGTLRKKKNDIFTANIACKKKKKNLLL